MFEYITDMRDYDDIRIADMMIEDKKNSWYMRNYNIGSIF